MHNPKIAENEVQRFEKEVQQKMEELAFSPSAAVWANVEKAISVEKKRRIPFFWLWLLPALLLMGGTGLYWMTGHTMKSPKGSDKPNGQPVALRANNIPSTANAPQQAGTAQPGKDPVTNAQPANKEENAGKDQLTNSQSSSIDPGPAFVPSNVPRSNAGSANTTPHYREIAKNNRARVITKADNPYFAARGTTTQARGTTSLSKGATSFPKDITSLSKGAPSPPKGTATRAKGATSRTETEAATTQGEVTTAEGIGTQQEEDDSRAPSGVGTPAVEKTINPLWSDIHLRPVNLKSIAAIQAAPLAKRPALAKALPGPKRPWEAGFTGGIGISSINQTLFKRASVVANDSRNLAAPVPVTGSASQTYVSKIRPDLSFWAGIFLQKPILNHLSVSFGLNLHYYSTKVSTGDKVVNNASNYYYSPAASLLSYASAPSPVQSYPYYAAGDKQSFINRYYFLEIPGSIQWQITHTRTLPLFWELGGSLSYLMGSNAIYYNTKAGVYYKDGQVSNRTQFNLSTALMVSLPLKGFQMQVGPQLQYGVTSLLNSESSGGQHLFYGGVKLVIFPGKLHKPGRRLFHGQ